MTENNEAQPTVRPPAPTVQSWFATRHNNVGSPGVAYAPPPTSNGLTDSDASELAARRAEEARIRAKYTGLNPLPVWYGFWAVVIGISAIVGLAHGQFGVFLLGATASAGCALYTRYLWRGGLKRWFFFIF